MITLLNNSIQFKYNFLTNVANNDSTLHMLGGQGYPCRFL